MPDNFRTWIGVTDCETHEAVFINAEEVDANNVYEVNIMPRLDKHAWDYITQVIAEELYEDGVDPATIGFTLKAYYTLESNCPHCEENNDG